jgi:hypothetical protein
MLTFLSDAMKRMEASFAKQTETLQQQNQAMQNKIVHFKRQAQQNRFQLSTKRDGGWDKPRQPQHNQNQKVTNPLETNNVVDEEPLPWCNPCNLPHNQESCMVAKEDTPLTSEIYMMDQVILSILWVICLI